MNILVTVTCCVLFLNGCAPEHREGQQQYQKDVPVSNVQNTHHTNSWSNSWAYSSHSHVQYQYGGIIKTNNYADNGGYHYNPQNLLQKLFENFGNHSHLPTIPTIPILPTINIDKNREEVQQDRILTGFTDNNRLKAAPQIKTAAPSPPPPPPPSPPPSQTTEQTTAALENKEEEITPCTPPKIPDYRAPGRRISDVKCYEHIWHLNQRLTLQERNDKCQKWQLATKGYSDSTFVVGGYLAKPGEYPHMGAIGWKAVEGTWIFKCGSSLISAKFVLTAAHCRRVSNKDTTVADPVPQIVRLGDRNIADIRINGLVPNDKKIIRIISHPQYKPPLKYYDIALMELNSNVKYSYVTQPACLWGHLDTNPLGNRLTISGWGVLKSGDLKTSPDLRVGVVDVIDTDVCNKLLESTFNRQFSGVYNHQICAGNLTGAVDACQGDSGGPLQAKINLPAGSEREGAMHYVLGVTSFGSRCGVPGFPGIYTRVASFIDWIEGEVWPEG